MIRGQTSRAVRVGLTLALMAASAICALKYTWWAACYSGWYGLPGYAQQLKDASMRANLYWWSVVVLEVASIAVVWSLVRLRAADMPQILKQLARLGTAAGVTATGTGIFLGLMILLRRVT
jgi:hypothetical protein